MTPPSREKPRLEPAAAVPAGIPSLSDELPRAHWILSNGCGWRVALSQNNKDVPPEILDAPSGVIFVGLYHGAVAALSPHDGHFIARIAFPLGGGVSWRELPGFVIAEGEMTVAVFRPSGEFLWQATAADVIESIELKDEALHIVDASGYVYDHDITTGKMRK
ncbi:MAG TPA: hypothetical protein VN915_16315 [Elusimicrobiota bacterium]|nr:hypothetical protein [Elusimicrobiota bacterium]